jgi:SAM-dependent methyltransferase
MDLRPIELAKNGAAPFLAEVDAELEAGRIDEGQWYRRVAEFITPKYLAEKTPWGQSGRSGDAGSWERARGLTIDAVDRDGTFLDVGCASGYLMECLVRWGSAKGVNVEPYGLDIAPELAELARARLPQWGEQIYVGNAMEWDPPRRFDFVRTCFYVPTRRRRDLMRRLLERVVAPGGRLIIGVYNEEVEERATEQLIASWGYTVAGHSERAHQTDGRLAYRVVSIERDE